MAKDEKVKDKDVSKVIHYYDKIMVAVVDLKQDLGVGDTVKFTGKDKEFTQSISSMQVEHEAVEAAKKGTEVAIKVAEPVKKNCRVSKVEE